MGDPILSVPLRTSTTTKTQRSIPKLSTRSVRRESEAPPPIYEVLFEESIDPHEDIDPCGFSRNEKVVVHEGVYRGIPLTVSRLHPLKK
jgi:hypothetical protein